jgi:hypothetical protein
MEIKINLLEVASELAELRMFRPFEMAGYTYDQFISKVMVENNDTLTYKQGYQEEFDMWYDFYFNVIQNIKINE